MDVVCVCVYRRSVGWGAHVFIEPYMHNHSAAEVAQQSAKLVTFLDLAGHARYLKTTLSGIVRQTNKQIDRPPSMSCDGRNHPCRHRPRASEILNPT
jgi:hypothetical protein